MTGHKKDLSFGDSSDTRQTIGKSVLLDVQSLRYDYGIRTAVDGASFVVLEGEIFGLLGPNGAGKTTTISCIAGLLAGWRGKMSFHGAAFEPARSPEDRQRLGVVPQNLALYENLTARENLEFFGRLTGLTGAKLGAAVTEALALAGLSERSKDQVREYSGGMKRRLNLAIGAIHRPALLLLDEPTAGVDPQSRNHIFESLLELRRAGRTLLYTTHYMEEAQRLCDRVAIMNEGGITAQGTQSELAAQAALPAADLEQVFLKLTGRSLRDE